MNLSFLPVLQTVRTYNFRLFRWDIVAGLTLAMFVLPESMAYAGIAGLPAEFGIYGCLCGGLLYAFFTKSDQLAVGPTSAISLMIGSSVGALAAGNYTNYLAIVSLTTFVVFCLFMLAYIFKAYAIINFVSDSVLSGFKAGAALSIASTQLPVLFGIETDGTHFFQRVYNLCMHLSLANFHVFIFALSSIAFMLILNSFFPGKPNALFLVLLSVLSVYLFPGFFTFLKPSTPLPEGLPQLHLPSTSFSDLDSIIGLAFGCFLMAFIETTSVARTLAESTSKDAKPESETLALGFANLAASFTGSMPVSGGLSQSQVNAQAGAKTPFALFFCSIFLALFLLFATKPLQYLPQVTLSVLVLTAMLHLLNFSSILSIRNYSKTEFYLAGIALIAVLIFGVLKGVIISSVISLIHLIANSSKPRVAELGRIPGTTMFSDIAFHPDNKTIEGILILRIESSVLYFNQQNVFQNVLEKINQNKDLKVLVLDLSSSPMVDVMGARMIQKLEQHLRKNNIQLRIVEALLPVREMLRKFKLEEHVGRISRKISLFEVIHEFESTESGSEDKIKAYW